MARNFKELQAKMAPASRAETAVRVKEELQRMAMDELRNAKRLTQTDMAEMLDVPQSSISRIEQRADMYLSTLRNYVHALGGVLQIQAVFPEGGAVTLRWLGEYGDQCYVVRACAEDAGIFRLFAHPLESGSPLCTKPLSAKALAKTLKALGVPEQQIAAVRKSAEAKSFAESGATFTLAQRVFSAPDLVAAGFESKADT